jgi:hypothetical protein
MNGIQVDAWARLDGHCPMKVEVVATEAQFEIGHRARVCRSSPRRRAWSSSSRSLRAPSSSYEPSTVRAFRGRRAEPRAAA